MEDSEVINTFTSWLQLADMRFAWRRNARQVQIVDARYRPRDGHTVVRERAYVFMTRPRCGAARLQCIRGASSR